MIKDRLKKKEFVLGTWCEIPSPAAVNVLARAGLDFVIIDMEHGPMDYRVAQEMSMAVEADGCEALIRVPDTSESHILRALDTGAAGIVVPHVGSITGVETVVEYARFAPVGKRGYNPYIRSGSYHGGDKDYFSWQNANTLLVAIVEGTQGLGCLREIAAHPEVDVVYVGTYDLSVALGVAGEVSHPKVKKALEDVAAQVNAAGKAVGCMIHNAEDLSLFRTLGIRFVTYKTDTAILYDAFSRMREELAK